METANNPNQCAPQRSCFRQSDENLGTILGHLAGEFALKWGRLNDLKTRIEQIYLPLKKACLTSLVSELLDNAFRYSRKGTQVSISSRSVFEGTRINLVNSCSLDDYLEMVKVLSGTTSKKKSKGLRLVKEQVAEFNGVLDFFRKGDKITLTIGIPYN